MAAEEGKLAAKAAAAAAAAAGITLAAAAATGRQQPAGASGLKGVLGSGLPGGNWNTSHLGSRMGVDLMAASAAGLAVAPVITMLDRAIIENASGAAPLTTSLRNSLLTLLTRPHTFLFSRPFALVFALYTGTYLAANTLDTVSATLADQHPATTTHGTPKFLATSAANLSLCLVKDAQFTKMFGKPGAAASAVPVATYALFATRDAMTVFASFCLPPVLAQRLPEAMEGSVSRAGVAQFVAPAAVQAFSTPLHLLGLDLYNRPGAGGVYKQVSWGSRAAKVAKDWGKSCLARVGRIVPAFGVGGVVNMSVRKNGMKALEDR